METIESLSRIAAEIRKDIVRMVTRAGGGHIGGSLSSVDILTALFFRSMRHDPANPGDPSRDKFILSKGHSVEAYYCALARSGYFPPAKLLEYGKFGSELYGHPTRKIPGIEMPTGALGHGLPVGVGVALADRRDGRDCRTFVLMGDGELAEGSVWEAAMAGAHYGLDNLVAIIDYNGLQISGQVDSVMRSSDLGEKWRSFGWDVIDVDGNDPEALALSFDSLRPGSGTGAQAFRPHLVIARTTKGKGVSFMENLAIWHHRATSQYECEKALAEIDSGIAEIDSSIAEIDSSIAGIDVEIAGAGAAGGRKGGVS